MDINNDIMRDRSSLPAGVAMNLTITPRQFTAVVGGLIAAVGLFAVLFAPVSVNMGALFGNQEVGCGTTVMPEYSSASGEPLAVCSDAIGARRAWGWPMAIGGGAVVAAALFVSWPPPRRELGSS